MFALLVLHVYLPQSRFSPSSFGADSDRSEIGVPSYESAFEDPLLAEIAQAIVSELESQTAGGGLLIEALAGSLAARPVQNISTHHSLSVFLAPLKEDSIDAGCCACWITSKKTWKVISR
jgi:AraC family transcriptional regulator